MTKEDYQNLTEKSTDYIIKVMEICLLDLSLINNILKERLCDEEKATEEADADMAKKDEEHLNTSQSLEEE